jgi:hypothetical protein
MLGLLQLPVAPRLAKIVARTKAALREFADMLEAEHDRQALRGDPATNAWELLCDVEALHRKLESQSPQLLGSGPPGDGTRSGAA